MRVFACVGVLHVILVRVRACACACLPVSVRVCLCVYACAPCRATWDSSSTTRRCPLFKPRRLGVRCALSSAQLRSFLTHLPRAHRPVQSHPLYPSTLRPSHLAQTLHTGLLRLFDGETYQPPTKEAAALVRRDRTRRAMEQVRMRVCVCVCACVRVALARLASGCLPHSALPLALLSTRSRACVLHFRTVPTPYLSISHVPWHVRFTSQSFRRIICQTHAFRLLSSQRLSLCAFSHLLPVAPLPRLLRRPYAL